MRIALHEDAVLVGAGLGLVAVHHDVAGEHAGRAEAPLDAGREAGAAPAQQAGALDLLGDLGRRHLVQRLGQRRVAAGLAVAVERVAVGQVPAGRDDLRDLALAVVGRGRVEIRHDRPPRRLVVAGQPHRLDVAVGRGHARPGVGELLADPAQRAVARDLVGPLAGPQVVDEHVDLVVGDAVEVAVVHLEARRLGAGGDALDVFERELAVGRGVAGLDAEAVLEVVQQLLAADQHARDVGADVDHVVAHRLALEHLVERRRAEHLGGGDVDQLGDVRHGVVGEVSVLLLRQVQQRDQRRLLDRIAGDDVVGHGRVLGGEGSWRIVAIAIAPRP